MNVVMAPDQLRDGDPKNLAPEGAVGPYIVRHPDGRLRNLAIDPLTGRFHHKSIPLGYDDDGFPIYGYNAKGQPVCACADKNAPGGYCHSQSRNINGRCSRHADESQQGEMHASYKHGRYDKSLPKNLANDYKTLMEDPNYLDLRSSIAIADLTILEAMRNIEADDFSPDTWDKLQKCRVKMEQFCLGAGSMSNQKALEKAVSLMTECCILMQHGGSRSKSWDRITEISLKRAKLVDVQSKRLREEKQNIGADQAYKLFTNIITIVKENVRDKIILRNIAMAIDRLARDPVNRAALGGTIDAAAMETQSSVADEIRQPEEDA